MKYVDRMKLPKEERPGRRRDKSLAEARRRWVKIGPTLDTTSGPISWNRAARRRAWAMRDRSREAGAA
jgi:hypothetical protein